jgi:hypothetical protein
VAETRQERIIRNLIASIEELASFRDHLFGCDVHATDFCTCGMASAMRAAKMDITDAEEFLNARNLG